MNHLAHIAEPRAVPFTATRYDAFKVSETGRTYELGQVDGSTVADAMNGALSRFALNHKEHLLIRETGERGIRLHLFAIKKKAAARYVYVNHVQKRVQDLYAAPVCSIDGGVVG